MGILQPKLSPKSFCKCNIFVKPKVSIKCLFIDSCVYWFQGHILILPIYSHFKSNRFTNFLPRISGPVSTNILLCELLRQCNINTSIHNSMFTKLLLTIYFFIQILLVKSCSFSAMLVPICEIVLLCGVGVKYYIVINIYIIL